MEMGKSITGAVLAVCAMGTAGAIDFTGTSISVGGAFVHGFSSAHTDALAYQIIRQAGAAHRTIAPPVHSIYSLDLIKKNRYMPTLGVSYNFSTLPASDFRFAVSALWDIGPYNQRFVSNVPQEFFLYRTSYKRSDGSDITNYQMETRLHGREHIALSLEPGYAFAKSTIGYMKFSYHYLRSALSSANTYETTADPENYEEIHPTPKANFNGIGIGAGVKQYLGAHLFIGAEVEAVRYQTLKRAGPFFNQEDRPKEVYQMESITPQVVATRVMVGYQF